MNLGGSGLSALRRASQSGLSQALRLRRAGSLGLLCLASALTACAPPVDQSGWEMARKKNPTEQLEAFPDIPLVLPGPSVKAAPPPTGSAMEAVRNRRLDPGSLFRRGFSAPTP
ncbi:MAG: hypothetical protein JNJ71_02215 [Rubrivivax sp.]|nr:hypothetical protein [Rubrivivax sp.]